METPKPLAEFSPKDQPLIELIDRTLLDHQLALEGIALIEKQRWEEHDAVQE